MGARFNSFCISFLMLLCVSSVAVAANPVATDSRIRTYVYGANEVFKIISRYGYQSNIEFGPDEEILTLSVGDSVAWKITPAGNRLFVKAMEEDQQSNLTVVTNKHAYQFDLSSTVEKDEDLVYLVRFYYPESDFDAMRRAPEKNTFESGAVIDATYNFDYSLTGPNHIAPTRVFDDGRFTFFKFPPNAQIPAIHAVDNAGNESALVSREDGGYVIVERVLPQFSLRLNQDVVCVFNDKLIARK